MENIVAETRHYQIVDMGENWRGYFTNRYHLERKAEFRKSRVMEVSGGCEDDQLAGLIPQLHAAERFHIENAAFCDPDNRVTTAEQARAIYEQLGAA
jgi:hypothetical protein